MKQILFAFGLVALLLLAGCAQQEAQPPAGTPSEEPSQPPGSDRDEHGCIPSAGYSWCESSQECVRSWETPCPALTEAQARAVAESSPCMDDGALTAAPATYNENSKTWWFEMDIERQGCSPACVVSEDTSTAEINWMCTGLIMPDESQECSYAGFGSSMTLAEAYAAAEASMCMNEGILDMADTMCNENTGTWWIGLDTTIPREGCAPACVVNVNSGMAEVNYRCTGDLDMGAYVMPGLPAVNAGGDACFSAITGKSLSKSRAFNIATRDSIVCKSLGTINAAEYICDTNTGTWQFGINPALPAESCTPYCIINVNSETAGVEWKCGTGASAPQ
ncbi:MAG: hypothetical protein PHQ80_03945 [Candidatus ainarchaeum sp.]|nr:hypothetical protein [Candidatus ainarchaeum sp.]